MIISFLLCSAAFLHFTLCRKAEYKRVYKGAPTPLEFWALQVLAWVFLLASLYPMVALRGAEIGTTLWFGVLTLAAMLVLWLTNYWPWALHQVWRLCPGSWFLAGLKKASKPNAGVA
ncbi:DUF3325 domain-containing protein [Halioxenophilus aromaticivorans]|uniref:DUF418 domain-containing protein n=1 Tax=Halioxenophilus aromaticivorans TaxID=1306992 RepID=A0AAV3U6R1_9ALTE